LAMRALLKAQCEVDLSACGHAQAGGMTIDHLFRGYHIFRHNGKRYLHIGWNSCNALAYKVLKHLGRDRHIISSYSGVCFAAYEDTLKKSKIFSADADKDFNRTITFDDVIMMFPQL